MSLDYVNRSHDEEIIDILRSVLDNGTGKAETINEHLLIKLMQLRGTPIKSFKFDQKRVDFYYNSWIGKEKGKDPDLLYGVIQWIDDNPILDGMSYFDTKEKAIRYIEEQSVFDKKLHLKESKIKYSIVRLEKHKDC